VSLSQDVIDEAEHRRLLQLQQNSEEEGEVELINCDYSTKRFPFTYAWWSAYGYKRHLTGNNMQDADDMKLVNQEMAYQDCGLKIKNDLLTGNAVVLFAYGLSGSGKTYTVFGPDATDAPEAWFKHADPQPLWVRLSSGSASCTPITVSMTTL
jgi:hypothetical protein